MINIYQSSNEADKKPSQCFRPLRRLWRFHGFRRFHNFRRVAIKTAIVYFAASILCVVVTNVYALFGHGARSDSMDYMFLYPLIGGGVAFVLLAIFGMLTITSPRISKKGGISRAGYNLYNAGIASLAAASMLRGIIEIAGAGTMWDIYIRIVGCALLIAGIACQASFSKHRRELRDGEEL